MLLIELLSPNTIPLEMALRVFSQLLHLIVAVALTV
jgi:hypothetical protein